MKNPHGLAVQGSQWFGAETLVSPDLLKEPLAGDAVPGLVKAAGTEGFRAPNSVGLGQSVKHLRLHFTPRLRKVKRSSRAFRCEAGGAD
jgi:hypothetical protein